MTSMPDPTPTLVILPGFDGTGRLLTDFAAALEPAVRVIVATYPSDVPLDYAGLEPVARSFLPPAGPFVLLAESFSGPLGITLAADSPPGLCGLILCASFARCPRRLPAFLHPLAAALPREFTTNHPSL